MADEYIINLKANTAEAERSTDSFFNSFGGQVTTLNQGLELFQKTINGIGQVFNKAIDLAKLGEEVTAVEKRFQMFARQAGVVPDQIADAISSVTKGTVDMGDALQAASQAMITFETSANKIPQLFELAKKASMMFGRDTIDIFNDLSMAIATGNTRRLKEIGIIVNAEQAYKNYAAAIGVKTDALSNAQKEEAISNAVLEQGNERLKNVTASLTPLTEALKVNKVAVNDWTESLGKLFNENFGGIIQKTVDWATGLIKVSTAMNEMSLSGAIPKTAEDVKVLTDQMTRLLQMQQLNPNLAVQYQAEIDAITLKLQQYKMVNEEVATNTKSTFNAASQATNITANQVSAATLAMRGWQDEYEKFRKKMDLISQQLGSAFKNGVVNSIVQGTSSIVNAIMNGQNALSAFGKAMLGVFGDMAIQMGTVLIGAGIGIESLKALGGFSAIAAGVGLIAIGTILKALSGGGSSMANNAGGGGGQFAPSVSQNTADLNEEFEMVDDRERVGPNTGVQVIVQGNILDRRETGLAIAEIINESFNTNGVTISATA